MVGQFYLPGLAHQQARRFASRHGLAYEDVLGAAYEGLCKAVLGVDPSLAHRYRELWIKALRVPVGVWVDVRLACGSPPVPLCQLHSQGLVEKTAAMECLSGREC